MFFHLFINYTINILTSQCSIDFLFWDTAENNYQAICDIYYMTSIYVYLLYEKHTLYLYNKAHNIFTCVSNSQPYGWTEWADFFLGNPVASLVVTQDKKVRFLITLATPGTSTISLYKYLFKELTSGPQQNINRG